MFHKLLGLYDEYVLFYELFKCYVIVCLLVNAGFEEKDKLLGFQDSTKALDDILSSQRCHAERVNFADKTDLPRKQGFSSDKQNNQALSFPKYAFKIKATRCLRHTFSPTMFVAAKPLRSR